MKNDLTAEQACAVLRGHRPRNPAQLAGYIKLFTGLSVPSVSLCAGHSSPLDYLWYAYSRDDPWLNGRNRVTNGDCIVWANRGGGRARRASGYFKIDDAISQLRRSSRAGFETEMLCLRPCLDNAVFAEFDPAVHVVPAPYDPALSLYRAMDFGFVKPFVCLWIQIDGNGVVRLIDEYVQSRTRIADHAETVKARTPCAEFQVAGTFCDPAGASRNAVTGSSEIAELRDKGIRCRFRTSRILDGIEKIRAALRAGDGKSRLLIDPKCARLIEALRCYHYPDAAGSSELPQKDGVYDHPIDALRYFFANWDCGSTPFSRSY